MSNESYWVLGLFFCVIVVYFYSDWRNLRKENRRLSNDYRNLQNNYNQLLPLVNDKKLLEVENDSLKTANQVLGERLNNAKEHFRQQEHKLNVLTDDQNKLIHELDQEKERCHILATSEITPEFIHAQQIIENAKDNPFVLITGGAGTGKSHFVRYILARNFATAIVAPTGIAALNIGGRTIHSYFKFPIAPYATPQLIPDIRERTDLQTLRRLVIDEISMVRADLLDLIDHTLRRVNNTDVPFGGVQIIAVGDLFQLPPVVEDEIAERFAAPARDAVLWDKWPSCFFFDAFCMKEISLCHVEFTKVFRQIKGEQNYVQHLNDLREFRHIEECLEYFNQRCQPPPAETTIVFPHRKSAQNCNDCELQKLPGASTVFKAAKTGSFLHCDVIELPVSEYLVLKPEARVMFVKNHPALEWVNGTLGIITAIIDESTVEVKNIFSGKKYQVQPAIWEETCYNSRHRLEVIGTYQQIPLVLAWAFTVHKVQGMTLPSLVYSPQGTFGAGMVYVAMSRTKRLENLYLKSPIRFEDIRVSECVKRFHEDLTIGKSLCQKVIGG